MKVKENPNVWARVGCNLEQIIVLYHVSLCYRNFSYFEKGIPTGSFTSFIDLLMQGGIK